MSIVPHTITRTLLLVPFLTWLWTGACLADPIAVTNVTVLHDGRSLLIEASAEDPGLYAAVDWVPGWLDEDLNSLA